MPKKNRSVGLRAWAGYAVNLSCVIRPGYRFWRGEEITADVLEYIDYAKAKGCSMTGPEDPTIETLNVLKGV
jgi:hypothetical protein